MYFQIKQIVYWLRTFITKVFGKRYFHNLKLQMFSITEWNYFKLTNATVFSSVIIRDLMLHLRALITNIE